MKNLDILTKFDVENIKNYVKVSRIKKEIKKKKELRSLKIFQTFHRLNNLKLILLVDYRL